MAAEKRTAFKDWFDRAAAKAMAEQLRAVYSEFDSSRFEQLACRKLHTLEFNARVQQFADAMENTLPADYPDAIDLVRRSLPPALVNCEAVTDGWLQWPTGQFIASYGLDHFEESMTAMVDLTQRFSAEFAVRPFVEKYPGKTFARLMKLTGHKSPHVRRWCSEGVRTRLPWGRKLHAIIADPTPVWPILDALIDDDEIYVRRSVANSINDLSKDHPQLVIERCKLWQSGSNLNRDWVIRQGLRSLVKEGDPDALALLGFSAPKKLEAEITINPEVVKVGQSLLLCAELTSQADNDQEMLVDFIVHYVRKNGARNAKVFKWKTLLLEAGSSIRMEKNVPMRETTVRALYAGEHRLELQVNGIVVANAGFELVV